MKSFITAPFMLLISTYLLLFVLLYEPVIPRLLRWWGRDDYSYCYLIPFIVVYLIWEKRTFLFEISSEPEWKGIYPFLLGVGCYWLGELGGEFYIMYISSWLILMGLCLFHMGWKKVKIVFFPLCFILTMFPLPNFFNFRITLALKLISTKIGVLMMRAYGMSAFQDGNVIDLGFTKLQVVDACSGLRYLFPLIVLGILVAYFFRSRWWKKIVIVLSTIPITILTNSLRIAFTGVLSERFGSKAVEGFFHDFEGLVIFMFALGCLVFEMIVLAKLFPEAKIVKKEETPVPQEGEIMVQSSLLKQPQFVVSVVLLGLTFTLSQGVEFREAIPMNKSFNSYPMEVGKWRGTPQIMEQKFINALDFSDYIMADYRDGNGSPINFYVAYYESQRKGESIHSPATCLRGGGWEFKNAGKSLVPLDGDGNMLPVNRAVIQKGSYRQISYYWFPTRGRNLTNAFELKWFTFWDALTRQRTDGALARVIMPVDPGEEVATAEKRLQSFIREMEPVLSDYLPQ
ncbi:MAG: VPLPA-CTERM-specific exosortase XrtD [Desulfobacteraceae bacterium]|nr:VPLPA-CTERM-specific exosortase XrtD [Desulfobacteraceae bacterium]